MEAYIFRDEIAALFMFTSGFVSESVDVKPEDFLTAMIYENLFDQMQKHLEALRS